MTTKTTDEDKNETELQEHTNTEVNTEVEIIDDDPVMIELAEVEAQLAALEKEKAEPENKAEGGKTAVSQGESVNPTEDGEGNADSKNQKDEEGETPMIPKGRLDKALSERDALREQNVYMKGLLDARKQGDSAAQTSIKSTNQNVKTVQEGVDEIETAISLAEAKKLELAEKYDEGEISTVDKTKAEIAIDKEIRELSKQRLNAIAEENKAHTNAVINATKFENWVKEQASEIQKSHPNVAAIDAAPEYASAIIWNIIKAEAAQNLIQRGIDVRFENDPHVRLAIMQERAKLSDRYTPEVLAAFLPEGYKAPSSQKKDSSQTIQAKTGLSDKVKNLSEKIDLANSQPPNLADMSSGAGTGELTASAYENMTDDQRADLEDKAPLLVKRLLEKSA